MSFEVSVRPPLGRPSAKRAQELRQIIITVASRLMLEHGYAGTSLETIANAAGVTKRTIYTRFESKENLLREILAAAALPALNVEPQFSPDDTLMDKLMRIAKEMNATLLHPAMQRWLRFAINGIAHHPEMAAVVHVLIEQYLTLLAKLLMPLLASEALDVKDSANAVKIFGTLISSPAHNLAAFALPPGSHDEQEQFMRKAIAFFIAGCRAESESHT